MVWPEVSIKPPPVVFSALVWFALMMLLASRLVKIENGSALLLPAFFASLPTRMCPPWVKPVASTVELSKDV